MRTPTADSRPTPHPGAGLTRAGRILLIVGGVLLMACGIAGTALAMTSLRAVDESARGGTVLTGSGSADAAAGDVLQLYVPEGESIPLCTVTGPDGADVRLTGGRTSSRPGDDGHLWTARQSFTAPADGAYAIACEGAPEVMVAPPVSLGGIFGGIGGIFLGVLGGGLGALLMILGLVLLLVGRSRRRSAGA